MGIVDRPVEDEPDERPDTLGRHLLRIKREYPGEWREAYEASRRETAVRIEGCLIGRGTGRIAGVTDIKGWEARLIERRDDVDGKQVVTYCVRVRYTPPKDEPVAVAPQGPGAAVVVIGGSTEAAQAAAHGVDVDEPGPETERVRPRGPSPSQRLEGRVADGDRSVSDEPRGAEAE